jgi:DNA polymerase I
MKKRLVLIDGHAVVFRAFYAFPTSLVARDGELANAVFGFSSILLSVIKELRPTHIAVAFDLDKPTFRHKEFVEYKAQRPKTDEDLKNQLGRVKEVVKILNIPIFEMEGFEADDVIGTLCKQVVDKKTQAVVVTGDQDAMQLVNGNVKVFVPGRGQKPAMMYGEKEVKERYGFKPIQMIDYKALSGDSSDNIPGIRGIGPKTALDLITRFGSVEALYSQGKDGKGWDGLSIGLQKKLIDGKEDAIKSKMLATIVLDVPIKLKLKKCEVHDYDKNKAVEFFMDLGFKSIANRLPGDAFEEDVEEMFVEQKKAKEAEKGEQVSLF